MPLINPPCFSCPVIMKITNYVTSHYVILPIVGQFLSSTSKYSLSFLLSDTLNLNLASMN